jgi:hypothetical protein
MLLALLTSPFLKVLHMSKIARILLVSLCFGITLVATTPAFAKKKEKTTSRHVVKSRIKNPDKETANERRLKRECKGQVNAGACAGYTR